MAAAAAASSKKRKAKQAVDSTSSVKKEVQPQQHVDKALAQKAVTALLQYHEKQQQKESSNEQLLGNDRPIHVQFGLEQAPKEPKLKPIRIIIPHAIHRVSTDHQEEDGLEDPEVCLIVKDSAQEWVQELVMELEITSVKKVLGLESLRKQYSRYNQRRELLGLYNVFMADDRILPMLTTALGKDFAKAKKLPLPIRLSKTTLPFSIRNNLSATFMTLGAGTSVSVRVGNTGMPTHQLVANVLAVAENAGNKLPRSWTNIRSIAIKTPESTSLPIYHNLSQEMLEIVEKAGVEPQKKRKTEDSKDVSQDTLQQQGETTTPSTKDIPATNKSPLVKALQKSNKDSSAKKEKKKETSAKKEKQKDTSAKKEKKKRKSTSTQ